MRLSLFGQRLSLSVLIAGVLLAVTLFFWSADLQQKEFTLKMTAGSAIGARAEIAAHLAEEARMRNITLDISPAAGSEEALELVERGVLDAALIQGGLPAGDRVRQAAALYPEPLHLLVSPEIDPEAGLPSLRGKTVNCGPVGSGTRKLSTKVMVFAGLSDDDYTAANYTYRALEAMDREELPDAIFMVQSIPSPVADFFVDEFGYHLMDIPYGRAMGYRDLTIEETEIPAMMYSVAPPIPREDIQTLGNNLLLVVRDTVPEEAVFRLLEATYGGGLAQRASLPDLARPDKTRLTEYPVHPGALSYHQQHEPFLKTEIIEAAENTRSFIVSVLLALFLLWRWYQQRQSKGFEVYIKSVSDIEARLLEMEKHTTLSLPELLRLRNKLGELKREALEKFASSELKDENLMSSFLHHVRDARDYTNGLLLHERTRLERLALQNRNADSPDAQLEGLWREAMEELGTED